MIWYEVDLEIFLYGKETEYVQAYTKEDAKIIASKKVADKYKCHIDQIEIVFCKRK
tara:strand:- start:20 stop:187 length:168 start_codon:yes stop_codon:yes gene_type:complete